MHNPTSARRSKRSQSQEAKASQSLRGTERNRNGKLWTAAFAKTIWGSIALGAVNGYITSGGDLKATLIGAVSGGIFNGIGTAFGDNLNLTKAVGKVLAHGVTGGLRSAALGGNFEDGFRSSAISQTFAVSGVYKHIPQDPFTQAAASSTVGGVTSELTGGSFEDGAITALYSHMLNDYSHMIAAIPSAIAVAMVDSPAIGPADIAAAGILIGAYLYGDEANTGVSGNFDQMLNESVEGADTPTIENFNDPTSPPAEGFKWKGRPGSRPGSKDGNWVNPGTKESLRPDLGHAPPIGPHWDYKDPNGDWWRIDPNGNKTPKKPRK